MHVSAIPFLFLVLLFQDILKSRYYTDLTLSSSIQNTPAIQSIAPATRNREQLADNSDVINE